MFNLLKERFLLTTAYVVVLPIAALLGGKVAIRGMNRRFKQQWLLYKVMYNNKKNKRKEF